MDEISLGTKFKLLRQHANLTISQLSKNYNINKSYLYQLEKDEKCPSIPMLLKLCDIYKVTPNDLLLMQDKLGENHFEIDTLVHKLKNLDSRDFRLVQTLIDKMYNDK